MVFGRSGGVQGVAWTIRCDSLELWWGLVLHGMGEIDFHVFGKYRKLTSSPNTSKLDFGPPDWSSDCFESQGTISGAIKPIIFPTNAPNKQYFPGNWETSQNHYVLMKWLPFLFIYLGPMGPGTFRGSRSLGFPVLMALAPLTWHPAPLGPGQAVANPWPDHCQVLARPGQTRQMILLSN